MPNVKIPKLIDGGKIVLYTPIDKRHTPTGNTRHTVHGTTVPAARFLAICQYDGEKGFYLFRCDENWQVLTDTFHASLSEAKDQAEFEFTGTSKTWTEP